MTTENNNAEKDHRLKLPSRLFVFSMLVGLLTPFIARLPSVPFRGAEWLTAYFAGGIGILFLSAFNLIPSFAWYGFGRASRKLPLAYWFSISGGVAFLLYAHGSINLSSSSTAAVGLVFIPIYAVGAILISWVIGCIINFIIKPERFRLWVVWFVAILAIIYGVVTPVQQSRSIVARESRFPYTAISILPLQKSLIYGRNSIGRVSVLSYDNFDKSNKKVIAALGHSNITVMNPITYEVIAKTEYNQEDCDGCVHMYPYLVPDKDGSVLVSTSDGVSNQKGQIVWQWEASGFSRVVPIQSHSQRPNFLSYQNSDYIILHNADGQELWRKNIPVSDIGRYNTSEGEQIPFAITGNRGSRKLTTYTQEGNQERVASIPEWVMNVEEISWPSRGHLLVGTGHQIAILDLYGNEILKHTVQDTSFNPYHGPEGTAVKFRAEKSPYLAIMCHGSSGYARSVLLIFDPTGKLVWQEELKKLSTIIALPDESGVQEVLLVGGLEGIIEYKISQNKRLTNH